MGMRVGSGGNSAALDQMRQAQSAQASKVSAAKPQTSAATQALNSAQKLQSQSISALLNGLGANIDTQA